MKYNSFIEFQQYIVKNDDLKCFNENNFDINKYITHSINIPKDKNILSEALQVINGTIHTFVSNNSEELIESLISVDKNNKYLQNIHNSIKEMNLMIQNIEKSIIIQKNQLIDNIIKLEKVHITQDLLNKTIKINDLYNLNIQPYISILNNDTKNNTVNENKINEKSILLPLSQSIKEIEHLFNYSMDTQYITINNNIKPIITDLKNKIIHLMKNKLNHGMKILSLIEISDALNVFFAMDTLPSIIDEIITELKNKLDEKSTFLLSETIIMDINGEFSDITKNQNNKSNNYTNIAFHVNLNTNLWLCIHNVMDYYLSIALEFWYLLNVLMKINFQVTKGNTISYLEYFCSSQIYKNIEIKMEQENLTKDNKNSESVNNLMYYFWHEISTLLSEKISLTLSYNKTILKNEIPALFPYLIYEANKKLYHTREKSKKYLEADIRNSHQTEQYSISETKLEKDTFNEMFSSFLLCFTDNIQSKVNNPIQLMFPPPSHNYHGNLPSKNDMNIVINILNTEIDHLIRIINLHNIKDDLPATEKKINKECGMYLIDSLLSTIKKSIDLLCDHIKNKTVIINNNLYINKVLYLFPRTNEHAHNISLLFLLHQLDEAVIQFSNKIVQENQLTDKIDIFQKSHVKISKYINDIIENYLISIIHTLETLLSKIHNESFSSNDNNSISNYMTDFSQLFHSINNEHFKRFPPSKYIDKKVNDIIIKLMHIYLNHLHLLRTLNDNGKMILSRDMAQFELLLETAVTGKLSDIGNIYEEMREFRRTMFSPE